MIISHKHQYIFVHCRKVAGSSITVFLNRSMGFRDIQIGSWKDTSAYHGRVNGRFYYDIFASHNGFLHMKNMVRHLCRRIWAREPPRLIALLSNMQKMNYKELFNDVAEHAAASNVKRCFPDAWDKYFTFCFVRNPWDRAVSDYKWCTRKARRKHIEFAEFIERVHDPTLPDPEKVVPQPYDNWPLYTIEDEIAVDFIGRFENLAQDMRHVCERIGLPFDADMFPHAKQMRKPEENYRSWYNDHTRALVAETYRKEIETFGYSF